MKQLFMLLIKAYRYGLSPFLGSHCRYYPTCSGYTLEALEHHGFWAGSWLGIRRLLRCHPWHEGGYDPVPENRNHRKQQSSDHALDTNTGTCCHPTDRQSVTHPVAGNAARKIAAPDQTITHPNQH